MPNFWGDAKLSHVYLTNVFFKTRLTTCDEFDQIKF